MGSPYQIGFTASEIALAISRSGVPVPITLPATLGWDQTICPLSITLRDTPGLAKGAYGDAGITAKALFNRHSTALSAPGATFYVNVSTLTVNGYSPGSDAANGLTKATPFKSIKAAIVAANTAAVPSKIIVCAGRYARSYTFVAITTTEPTVDIAFCADGGRVRVTQSDEFSAPSLDGTQTNCYALSVTAGSVLRVWDLLAPDRFGQPTELIRLPTAAQANATPNSWSDVAGTSGTTYINRRDRAAVTFTNTCVLRTSRTLRVTTQMSLYFGPLNDNDSSGFDLEGGESGTNGAIDILIGSGAITTNVDALVCENCSFRGGYRAVSVDGLNGIAGFWNCRFGMGTTDGLNAHNTNGATKCLLLTVNCSFLDNGRYGEASCNGLTIHDTNMVGIDIAGFLEGNHGGSVRNVGTSKMHCIGTHVRDDLGDIMLGSVTRPAAFYAGESSTIWCERVKVDMQPTTQGYVGNTGTIYRKDCWPTANPTEGTVTDL